MANAPRRKDSGIPESVWHTSNEWQITTWETSGAGWAVRVDGPDSRFWETYRLECRDAAYEEGIAIIEGFNSHD